LIIGEPRRFWITREELIWVYFIAKIGDVQEKTLVVVRRAAAEPYVPAVRVCPVGALTKNGFSAPQVDIDKCIRCGKCFHFCPMRALRLQ
jgi:Fe-S-cluster-containing hydrogenase component 2